MSESIRIMPVGLLEVNCCLVQNPGSDTLYIIDPGGDDSNIVRAARDFTWKKAVILFTHAHVDHIFAAGKVKQALDIKNVYLNPADLEMYRSPANALEPYIPCAQDLPETTWPVTDPDVETRLCPGHSPGGSAYVFHKLNIVFAGDTIFRASVGRTDLPGGDYDTLIRTIREQIFTLPDTMRIIPGHGEDTTTAFEKRCNPYLK